MVLNKALATTASVGPNAPPNTARSKKGDEFQTLKGIRSDLKTSIIPEKNAGIMKM